MMKKFYCLFILLSVFFIPKCYADRGSIPFKPHVKVFEPTQRALIAWNGQEEILLLSTDLKASEPTKILEVIPLPSEPEVKKGDVEVFKKATALINQKLKKLYTRTRGTKYRMEKEEPPAGEVTFHQKIGAHDISVTHVLRSDGFIKWVKKYLKAEQVKNPLIPDALKTVIDEYIAEGFSWFVFDVVLLKDVPQTNDAIQYRFRTDFLFYPVKITRTEEGYTSINLLVLTPKLFKNFPGIPAEEIKLRHPPVSISSSELRSLNEEIYKMFDHRKDMKLRIWEIKGKLSSFTKDLIAK